MKKILSLLRQAIQTYDMINTGDKIAVGVSGGKDSLVLLKALKSLGEFYPKQFEIIAISIDTGFDNADYEPISNFCKNQDIEYTIIKTQIKEIVFDNLKAKSPCALCSKMRRAALCEAALAHGCTKLALGHNKDDATQTYMMNLIYNGNAMCFEPVTYYEDKKIAIIRPLVFASEYETTKCAAEESLPVMDKICPYDGNSKREDTKNLIYSLRAKCKNAEKNIFTAIKNSPEFKKYEKRNSDETNG